jgi:hypothetical protein
VLGGVPAVGCDVDATGEGQAVVDHHDLLVVRAADRVVGVDTEGEPIRGAPVEQHDRLEPSPQRTEHAEVPLQDADLQPRIALHRDLQDAAQPVVPGATRPQRVEPDPGVEVPADEEHALFGAQDRTLERREVVGGVDEDGVPGGPLDPPAGLAGDQQGVVPDRFAVPVRRR